MGLLDRFRLLGSRHKLKHESVGETAHEEALRLINQGNVIEEAGHLDEALQLYDKAINKAPDLARAHMNRGNIFLARGDAEAALRAYEKALELEPDYPAAHYNAGNAKAQLNKHDAACAAYEKAILLKPDFTDAYFALGCSLEDLGRLDEAIDSYQRALSIDPDYPEIQANLGRVLTVQGQLDKAIASLKQATPQLPKDTGTLLLLGLLEKSRGQLKAACENLSQVLATQPENMEVNFHLGATFLDLGEIDKAISCFRKALQIEPDNFPASINLGNALFDAGRYREAVESYRKALALQPESGAALGNLGMSLKDIGQAEEGLTLIRKAIAIDPELINPRSNLLFISHHISDRDHDALFEDAKAFGQLVAKRAKPFTSWKNSVDSDRPLRIGLVSGDLCHHPVGFFIEGVLQALHKRTPTRLEIYAYINLFRSDEVSARIKALCHRSREIFGLSDEETAELIQQDEIDILIDLSGHSAGNRLPLFAWKPAPVQATWLGYFDTTGVEAIDYLIADPITLPASEERYFSEQIWRLPETRLCFTPPEANITIRALPALENNTITFGCFNSLTKMGDPVIALWSRLLLAVPNSRLFIKARQLNHLSEHEATVNRFRAHGIDSVRLILEGPDSRANYLAAYNRIDIALDPFPYTGGTTTAEALWMGVPVLTLSGKHFLARQGEGLLLNAGLPEWVAADPDDYVAKAAFHASDLKKLATLRATLRQKVLASPIFDSDRFAMHFENALRGMWAIWCEQENGRKKQTNI